MTLNANSPGATVMAPRRRLDGPERGLDAFVGLVILIAEVAIGMISIFALYQVGAAASLASARDELEIGFAIALIGGSAMVIITTIVYLARVVIGRRSWPAPLWGAILMSIMIVIGYFVMFAS